MAYKTLKSLKMNKKTRKNRKGGSPTECKNANVPCESLDTQYTGKLNQTWKTCIDVDGINHHIFYITPKNVFIKSIETGQIPEFNVKTKNGHTACKIMIEDKYISCFLFICGNWYAIMRLFGKTINTEYFARTEKNRAFFKLTNVSIDIDTNDPTKGTGLISIPSKHYTIVKKKTILSTSNAPTIQLKPDSFININKKNIVNNKEVFYVLQIFRLHKLLGNHGKHIVAHNVALDVIENI